MLLQNKNTLNSKKTGFKETNNKSVNPFKENNVRDQKKSPKINNQNTGTQKMISQAKQTPLKPFQEKKPLKAKDLNILGQSAHFKENNSCQTSADYKKKQYGDQYFTFQNYSFRKLSSEHREEALALLTQNFIEEEPLAKSYYLQFPEEKAEAYQFWEEYWNMFMDDAIQSGVSVAVVDLDKNQELIGVYTFKNFNYLPPCPQHDQKYLNGFTIVSAEVVLQEELIQQSPEEVQDILLNSPKVAQAWAAAIKDQHTGKKLYSKMTALAQNVLRDAGYEYALVFASNFLSSKVLKKLQFTKLSEVDCEQFEMMGKKPFAYIENLHRHPSLWFKSFKC